MPILSFFTKVLVFQKKCTTFAVQYRGMEQLAARWAHNPKVAGSSPAPATHIIKQLRIKNVAAFLFGTTNSLQQGIKEDQAKNLWDA